MVSSSCPFSCFLWVFNMSLPSKGSLPQSLVPPLSLLPCLGLIREDGLDEEGDRGGGCQAEGLGMGNTGGAADHMPLARALWRRGHWPESWRAWATLWVRDGGSAAWGSQVMGVFGDRGSETAKHA